MPTPTDDRLTLSPSERRGLWSLLQRGTWRSADGIIDVIVKRATSPDAADLVEREARALRAIDHPNVRRIVEVLHNSGAPALVLEYVDGINLLSLAERVRGTGGWPPEAAAFAVRELCRGLHAAHEEARLDGRRTQVVHLDVHPSNVLVSGDGRVQLIDFGVCSIDGDAPPSESLHECSPRDRTVYGEVDPRTDVYSAGAVLRFLIAPEPAHSYPLGWTTQRDLSRLDPAVAARWLSKVAGPQSYAAEVDGDLMAIADRAADLDRERRYSRIADMAAELDRYLDGAPSFGRDELARLLVRTHPAGAGQSRQVGEFTVLGFARDVVVQSERSLTAHGHEVRGARVFLPGQRTLQIEEPVCVLLEAIDGDATLGELVAELSDGAKPEASELEALSRRLDRLVREGVLVVRR
jgi:serine/threonine protein kinase